MRKLTFFVIVMLAATAGCSDGHAALEVKPGSTVTLQKKDGVTVVGRLVEVKPEHLVIETRTGRTEVRRAEVTTLKTDSTSALNDAAPAVQPVGSTGREPGRTWYRRRTSQAPGSDDLAQVRKLAANAGDTACRHGAVVDSTRVGSDQQRRGSVRGTLRRPVVVGGAGLPRGTAVIIHVTRPSARRGSKGARGSRSLHDHRPAGDAERLTMRTDTVARLARRRKGRTPRRSAAAPRAVRSSEPSSAAAAARRRARPSAAQPVRVSCYRRAARK
jgi:hypothetical protein